VNDLIAALNVTFKVKDVMNIAEEKVKSNGQPEA
jgi:hypothetical protein